MKLVENKRFKESYIETTLDNGLKVILWNKPGFNKSYFMMATPFGGSDSYQEDEKGEIHSYPHGVAHFLEHKMFEKEGQDVMEEFSTMGANVNAFTSYTETAYYFSTSTDPIKPLHLLMDFVQKLSISEESVEKEKGIIIQELEMYKQMSDARIINDSMETIFYEHPLKNDIAGTTETVNAITYDILQECYRLNYHPQKMILIGVSSMDPKVLLKEIEENQAKKTFAPASLVHRKKYVEPKEVKKKESEIEMDISINKLCNIFKFEGIEDSIAANKMEWCLRLALDLAFSPLAPEYQSWLDDEIINDYFSYDVEIAKDYGIIIVTNETNKKDEFYQMVAKRMKNLAEIDEKELVNLKRRYFGSNIKSLNSFDAISVGFMRMYFNDLDFFEGLEIVEQITKADLIAAINLVDIENNAKIIIKPKHA